MQALHCTVKYSAPGLVHDVRPEKILTLLQPLVDEGSDRLASLPNSGTQMVPPGLEILAHKVFLPLQSLWTIRKIT